MQSSRVSSLYSTINNCHDIECLKNKRIFQGPTRQAKHIGKQNLTKAASRYLVMKRLYFSKLYCPNSIFPNCIFFKLYFSMCTSKTHLLSFASLLPCNRSFKTTHQSYRHRTVYAITTDLDIIPNL